MMRGGLLALLKRLLRGHLGLFTKSSQPGWCNLCRRPTVFYQVGDNTREDITCRGRPWWV